jgi:probable phosphoglycerate mutase
MILIVARHGRTFAPQQRPVWIGAAQDPPLVAEGEREAERLRQALVPIAPLLRRFETSPMQRTRQFAALCRPKQAAAVPHEINNALLELDYGTWGGLDRHEVLARSGPEALAAWEEGGQYPEGAGFAPPRAQVLAALTGWLNGLAQTFVSAQDVVVAVTHGGTLRLLVQALGASKRPAQPKMACGHIGVLQLVGSKATVRAWNGVPDGPSLQALCAGADHPKL